MKVVSTNGDEELILKVTRLFVMFINLISPIDDPGIQKLPKTES